MILHTNPKTPRRTWVFAIAALVCLSGALAAGLAMQPDGVYAARISTHHYYYLTLTITNNLDSDQTGYLYVMKGSTQVLYSPLWMVVPAHSTLYFNEDPMGADPQHPMLIMDMSEGTFGTPPYMCTVYFKAYDYSKYGYVQTSNTAYFTAMTDWGQYAANLVISTGVDDGMNHPPTINVNSPPNGGTISGTMTMSGTATDDDGVVSVEASNDNANWMTIYTFTGSPKTGTWSVGPTDISTVANGDRTFYFRSFDGLQYSPVKTVTFTVQNEVQRVPNTPPTATIDSPAGGAQFKGEVVTVSASATDPDGDAITFTRIYINSALVANATGDSASYSWNTTNFNNGAYTIKAEASDGTDISEQAQITVSIQKSGSTPTVPVVNSPPTVTITSPASLSTAAGAIDVRGTASDSDGTVENVTVKVGGSQWMDVIDNSGIGDFSAWSISLDSTELANGNYTIYVRAIDNSSSATIKNVTVRVNNNNKPSVQIISPMNASVVSDTVNITGTASDPEGSAMTIRVRIDNSTAAAAGGNASGTTWWYAWNTTSIADGYHNITVYANDGSLNSDSKTVYVRVKNQRAPRCSITYPSPNEEVNGVVTISGEASDVNLDNLTVTFGIGGSVNAWYNVTDITLSPSGTYEWTYTLDSTQFQDERTLFMAKANDSYSDSVLARTTAFIKNTQPTCEIISPIDGALFSNDTIDSGDPVRIWMRYNVSSVAEQSRVIEVKAGSGNWTELSWDSMHTSNKTAYYDWDVLGAARGNYIVQARVNDSSAYSPVSFVNITLGDYFPPQNITILSGASSVSVDSIMFANAGSQNLSESITAQYREGIGIVSNISNDGAGAMGAALFYLGNPDADGNGKVDANATLLHSEYVYFGAASTTSINASWTAIAEGGYKVYIIITDGARSRGRMYESAGSINVLADESVPGEIIYTSKVNLRIERTGVRVVQGGKSVTQLASGMGAQIKVEVKNNGGLNMSASQTVILRVYDGPVLIKDSIVPILLAGRSVNVTVDWIPDSSGAHQIRAVVDEGNSLDEANETDNSAVLAIDVAEAPTPQSDLWPYILAVCGGGAAAATLIIFIRRRIEERKLL